MTVQPQSRLTGAISVLGAQAVLLALGYVAHLWIGRVLGPAPYGVYGVVLSLQSIFGLLLTLGVPVAISRFVAQDEAAAKSILKKALRLQLVVAFLVAGLMLILSPFIARLLGDKALLPYLMFSVTVVFCQAFYPLYVQFFSGLHLFSRQALLTTLYAVIKLAGALSLIYFLHIYGAFAGFLIGGLAAAAFGWYWTRHLGGTRPATFSTRDIAAFAGLYVLVLLGIQILMSLDLFMVKALLKNDVLAGYYNSATTLARISYLLLQSLGFIVLPSIAKLTKPGESHDEAARFISDTIRYLIALIVPSVALAAATSQSLILLFYSGKYLPAASTLTILMIGLGALAFFQLLTSIVAGAGRPAVCTSITAALLVLSLLLGFMLIPRYGLIGAAWQTTITGLIGLSIMSAYTFRTFRIPVPFRSLTNILVASAVAISCTYLWRASALTLLPQYLLVAVVYIAMLLLLKEINAGDRRRLASLHPFFSRFIA